MSKVLIVEDDAILQMALCDLLQSEGFTVESAGNGGDALQLLSNFGFDAVVLDWDLPEISGIEICRRYRLNGGRGAVIMLTGKSKIEEKGLGFSTGADDYLTKPFEPEELVMRLRAMLRRSAPFPGDKLELGKLVVDSNARTAFLNGEKLKLRPKEYGLLEYFLRHKDKVSTPEEILSSVWKSDEEASTDAIRVWVHRLRGKLPAGEGVPSIKNVPGIGYQLSLDQSATDSP